jgi:FolB domain-containing protein
MSIIYPSCLRINDLKLMVHLGFGAEERHNPQKIKLNIELYYSNQPLASREDGVGFICYHQLTDALKLVVLGKEFALIEYLARELCDELERFLANAKQAAKLQDVRYILHLHKCFVPVADVENGATYSYTNLDGGLL